MGQTQGYLLMTAVRRIQLCAKSYAKSRRMCRGLQAHSRALNSLTYPFKLAKTQSTTCSQLMQSWTKNSGIPKEWTFLLGLFSSRWKMKFWLFRFCKELCRASLKPKLFNQTFKSRCAHPPTVLLNSPNGALSTQMAWKSWMHLSKRSNVGYLTRSVFCSSTFSQDRSCLRRSYRTPSSAFFPMSSPTNMLSGFSTASSTLDRENYWTLSRTF